MAMYEVSAFYKFTELTGLPGIRQVLEKAGRRHGIIGTILLAPEGINSTIAAEAGRLDPFMRELRSLEPFRELEEKRSGAAEAPFHRFKVRIKKEIVTLGVPGADPRKAVGTYVEPENWRQLIEDPETLLVDTRNDYEVGMGRFKGAIDPHTASFREFPQWAQEHLAGDKNRKIAMYCTGGIRCEKATSLLKQMGYGNVYHLKGGILKYLETVPPEESVWEGSCFVFDQRVGLQHGLDESDHTLCHGCRRPLSSEDLEDPRYEPGVSCPHCADGLAPDKKERLRERQRQVQLARQRGESHIGIQTKVAPER